MYRNTSMNKKIVSLVCVIIALPIITIIGLRNITSSRHNDTLIVGTVAGYAPFVSINPQGEYEGFDIDVANALARHINKKLILKDLGSMTALFMALEQGSIDAAIWALSITQDRLAKVAMVKYQGETTTAYPLIFWKKIPAHVTSITDMEGMIVCVEPHSSQDAVLQKYPFITTKPTERVDDALLNIQYGKADAAFVEPAIANKFKAQYPEIQILNVPLAPEDQVHGIGIVLRKDNNILIDTIQKAINALISDGTIQIYEKKWNIS